MEYSESSEVESDEIFSSDDDKQPECTCEYTLELREFIYNQYGTDSECYQIEIDAVQCIFSLEGAKRAMLYHL
ncbi:MAG: hypothetical protein AAFO15_00245 [Pseudomonadota bacterium]